MERFSELCTIWTETVKFALDDLKEVRNHFEVYFPFTDFIKVLTCSINLQYVLYLGFSLISTFSCEQNKKMLKKY